MNEFKTVDDIPEDLRWLAENVHEWPGYFMIGTYRYPNCPDEVKAPTVWGHQSWQRARDLISGKPSWGDAPADAEILVQQDDGEWVFGTYGHATPSKYSRGWIGYSPGTWIRPHYSGTVLGDWRNTLEKRPSSVSIEVTGQAHIVLTDEEAGTVKADGYLSDHINALSQALPDGVSVTVGINPGVVNLHDGVTSYIAPVDEAGDMVETWLKLSKWEVKSDV